MRLRLPFVSPSFDLLSGVLAAFGAAGARLPLALYAATAAAALAPGLAATTAAALTPGLTAALAALTSLTTLAGAAFATRLSAFGRLTTALLIGHRFLLEVFFVCPTFTPDPLRVYPWPGLRRCPFEDKARGDLSRVVVADRYAFRGRHTPSTSGQTLLR